MLKRSIIKLFRPKLPAICLRSAFFAPLLHGPASGLQAGLDLALSPTAITRRFSGDYFAAAACASLKLRRQFRGQLGVVVLRQVEEPKVFQLPVDLPALSKSPAVSG